MLCPKPFLLGRSIYDFVCFIFSKIIEKKNVWISKVLLSWLLLFVFPLLIQLKLDLCLHWTARFIHLYGCFIVCVLCLVAEKDVENLKKTITLWISWFAYLARHELDFLSEAIWLPFIFIMFFLSFSCIGKFSWVELWMQFKADLMFFSNFMVTYPWWSMKIWKKQILGILH